MILSEEEKRFEASLKKSVNERIETGFIKTYKPVLRDKNRVFDTMKEYKKWCDKHLPKYLGYSI